MMGWGGVFVSFCSVLVFVLVVVIVGSVLLGGVIFSYIVYICCWGCVVIVVNV